MATLGSAILNRVLGHSEAEKVFRPWWDNLEDLLVYGLVMLGLMVVPTSLVTGNPLECTFCQGDLCMAYNDSGTVADPEYYMVWVKKFCTFNGSVDSFLLYFPYILLLIALVLVLIEKIFLALFKTNQKLEKFYKLLVQQNIVEQGSGGRGEAETRLALQVEESFHNSEENYFASYLIRTCLELAISILLLAWILFSGVPVIFSDVDIIPCQINSYLFLCSGHPQEFYKFILSLAIAFISLYIIANIYNLFWILSPKNSKFYKIMKNYREALGKGSHFKQGKRIDELYFHNLDLRLLLNLLTTNFGVGAAISALCLFDKDLHDSFGIMIYNERKSKIKNTIQIIIKKPSMAFLSSLKHCEHIRVKIIVEISPNNDNPAVIVDVLENENDEIKISFDGMKEDKEYTVSAILLVSGKETSSAQHIIAEEGEGSDDCPEEGDGDKKNV